MTGLVTLRIVLAVVIGWLDHREREAVAYLIEENRLLRRQLGGRRLGLTDDDRRRLAARAYRIGRAALRRIASIATPDTLLRWHRELISRNLSAVRPYRRFPKTIEFAGRGIRYFCSPFLDALTYEGPRLGEPAATRSSAT